MDLIVEVSRRIQETTLKVVNERLKRLWNVGWLGIKLLQPMKDGQETIIGSMRERINLTDEL